MLYFEVYRNWVWEKIKERRPHINWSMVIPEKVTPVTGTTLRTTGPGPADSRQ